jgi:hypothetical protein
MPSAGVPLNFFSLPVLHAISGHIHFTPDNGLKAVASFPFFVRFSDYNYKTP